MVPVVDVVDRPPGDLENLVRLGAQRTTGRVAEVHDRDDAVGSPVEVGLARPHAHELVDLRHEPDLLLELAHDGLLRRLARFHESGDEAPPSVVDAAYEQHAVVVVEECGVDPDLGGHVAQLGVEARPHDIGREPDPVGVLTRRELEQALAPLAIEGIGRVVQTSSRDGADLVEQRDDVDALDATWR